MTKSARVQLGEIGSAHGIRGEVVVRSFTADPADIAAYGAMHDAAGRPVPALKVVRVTQRGVICRVDGITDRTTAERLRGTALWIERSKLPPPEPGDYYHADLIGMRAVHPDGVEIGTVVTVANFGAGDLLEIRMPGGSTEYVPFTNACVPDVDIATGTLTLVMPESTGDPDEAAMDGAGLDDDEDVANEDGADDRPVGLSAGTKPDQSPG